jgi:hypothetical protein
MKTRTNPSKPKRTKPDDRPRGKERLELICSSLIAGKSRREIALELGWDEGTIRRDIKKLYLPEDKLNAIADGDSAEKHLRVLMRQRADDAKRVRHQRGAEERRVRIPEEQAAGVHSEALAKLVLDWLMTKELTRPDEEMILDLVERESWMAGDQPDLARRDSAKVFALCDAGDPPGDMTERIDSYVNALVSATLMLAPERLIRHSAIKKAWRAAHNPARRPVPRPPWGRHIS